ncbi:Uncharacterised protein g3586 [Pycnogonum litorale]
MFASWTNLSSTSLITLILFSMIGIFEWNGNFVAGSDGIGRKHRNGLLFGSNVTKSRLQRSFLFRDGTRIRFKPQLQIPVLNSENVKFRVRFRVPVIDFFIRSDLHGRNSDVNLVRIVEDTLTSAGFDGRKCVRRYICEIIETPQHKMGLFGDVLDMIVRESLDNLLENDLTSLIAKGKNGERKCSRNSDAISFCPSLFGV